MNRDHQSEIWQVEVGGQIYEAPLAELPEWIGEGSLQPGDKVRKGNLRWIEAQKVPVLVPFFNAKARGDEMPLVQSVTDGAAPVNGDAANACDEKSSAAAAPSHQPASANKPAAQTTRDAVPGQCSNHRERPVAYICTICGLQMCSVCPSSYGSSVRICPDCGSLCRSMAETAERSQRAAVDSGIGAEAFGFSDFGRAISYPFRFKSSLFFGGLMFMIFSIGQSASSIGGLFLVASSIICFMLANMVVFGVRAHLIDNFTQGNLDVDFMPGFEDFSIWDDVVHPFFLYIAAMISSFGPFLLVLAVSFYLILSAATAQAEKFNQELARVPGTQVYAHDRTAEQTKEVNEILGRMKEQNERRAAEVQRITEFSETGEGAEPEVKTGAVTNEEDLEELLNEIRSRQQPSAAPVQMESEGAGYTAAVSNLLHLAAPLVVFGFLTLVWGLFYYPAACAVAGYTRSFMATINPMVGLDTIRRLGVSYLLILIMGLLLGVMALTITGVLAVVLAPLSLPRIGNLPATVLGSFVTFYFSVVFSGILGYALFKSRDRLELSR